MKNKTWFITGASKGLGLVLVKRLLEKGCQVAATSRKIADLQNAIGTNENFLPLQVDLVREESVGSAIENTIKKFGSINVVVNNAGYGLIGSLEELSDVESRSNFDTNVFGALNVIRKAMPHLRAQKSGHIFNITSIGGFNGNFPGFGIYTATKFAMHGFSEALAEEVKQFGVKVTIVSPGYFRTNFLDSDSLGIAKNEIKAYEAVRQTQIHHQQQINGNQPGDPLKGADVMIDVANQDSPVLHLFLGQDAYDFARAKITAVEQDMKTIQSLATSTSFDSSHN